MERGEEAKAQSGLAAMCYRQNQIKNNAGLPAAHGRFFVRPVLYGKLIVLE